MRGCVASPRAGFPFPFPFFPFVIFCFSVASSVSAACSRLAELRSSASSSVVTAGCDALYCATCDSRAARDAAASSLCFVSAATCCWRERLVAVSSSTVFWSCSERVDVDATTFCRRSFVSCSEVASFCDCSSACFASSSRRSASSMSPLLCSSRSAVSTSSACFFSVCSAACASSRSRRTDTSRLRSPAAVSSDGATPRENYMKQKNRPHLAELRVQHVVLRAQRAHAQKLLRQLLVFLLRVNRVHRPTSSCF